jgi:His/Glu/Gln/Arg/opine family amino acid ABC transporter permease subunit
MFGIEPEYWAAIGQGVLMTLWLTFASSLIALTIGVLLGVMRSAPIGFVRSVASGYTEFFRNVPLLTVLFFMYYGVPNTGLDIDAVTSAIIGLGFYTGAYVGEVVRSGLETVSKGNIEAARSLGLSFLQSMWHVQLPQALRAAIPPLGTLLIALLKNTSLAATVTVQELFFQSRFVQDRTFNPDVLLISGAIYLAMTLPLGALVSLIERKWAILR